MFHFRQYFFKKNAKTTAMLRSYLCKYSHNTIQESKMLFIATEDRYNGLTIEDTEKSTEIEFNAKLDCFNFHHARDDFVMMYKWLPDDSEPNLPPACHTNLGVGALVFNRKNQMLAISEKHYEYPHWKLPGGYVEKGEDIVDAAIREVKEETGVDVSFLSLITLRHSHNMMYGNSDIYLLLMMNAISDEITLSQREVKDCKWMDIKEYTTHPHVHEFNRLIVRKALDYKTRNIKLDIQKRTVKWSQFVREMNILSLEDYNYH
ncbi:uncharacterized protein LOC101736710 isoform X3 [Bombyx mori]|uniref:Nudix hydrolase domain-containing protein n=1 Tax=Bombyx mori TaxID=7091 RepID=A0A8R2R434_BOMMO|nr:nudix hydrolase 8 isoform X4 [Bombyx mori]